MNAELSRTRIGIVSDTHGTLPAICHTWFAGVNRIIHAGDIGSTEVLIELKTIAPVTAVYGNCDPSQMRFYLKEMETLDVDDYTLCVRHIPFNSRQPDCFHANRRLIIIHGHTHRADISQHNGTLIINPGSISKPRYSKKPSAALLTINPGSEPDIQILE